MKKKTVKSVLAVVTALSMMSSITVMAKEENKTASQEDFLNDLKTGIENPPPNTANTAEINPKYFIG